MGVAGAERIARGKDLGARCSGGNVEDGMGLLPTVLYNLSDGIGARTEIIKGVSPLRIG